LRPVEPETLELGSPTDDAKSKELPASGTPMQLADIKPGQVGRSLLSPIGFWPGGDMIRAGVGFMATFICPVARNVGAPCCNLHSINCSMTAHPVAVLQDWSWPGATFQEVTNTLPYCMTGAH